ncbi:MAG: ACT domain-containing protein, partial [Solirubrobacterales bacterium]
IHCRSSFHDRTGTMVVSQEETMEQPLVTAVTHATDEARVTVRGVPDRPGVAGELFTKLADANINVDMIIQNESMGMDHPAEMTFTVPKDDLAVALDTLHEMGEFDDVDSDPSMGKVSVIGAGMRSHPGVAAKVFTVLGQQGINLEMISTSPIKISCVIDGERVADAVKALHDAFELGVAEEQATGDFRPIAP